MARPSFDNMQSPSWWCELTKDEGQNLNYLSERFRTKVRTGVFHYHQAVDPKLSDRVGFSPVRERARRGFHIRWR
jgi:hypothetical protein